MRKKSCLKDFKIDDLVNIDKKKKKKKTLLLFPE